MQSIYALLLASATISGPTGVPTPENEADVNSLQVCVVTKIKEIDVPASEQGILDVLEVQRGSLVRKNQPLGKVDDQDALLARQVTMYEKETAKMLAEDTVRQRAAVKQHKVSQAEYEEAVEANERLANTYPRADVRRRLFTAERDALLIEKEKMDRMMAAIDEKAKEAQLLRANALVARHRIVAPFDGEVTQIYKNAREWVNPGDPILRVVRMDKLRVAGFVPAKDFARHEIKGKSVLIEVVTTGGGIERFRSEISYVANEVSGGRYQVGADIDNTLVDGEVWLLNPGLKASMKLQSGVALAR